MNSKLFESITENLVKDGYIVIEDALDSRLLEGLLLSASDESAYQKAGISKSSDLHIDRTKRSDKTLWLDEDGGSVSEYLSFAQELQKYLNRALYLGLNYYETHFAIYEKGDFYEKHRDAFKGSKNRVVTTVLYLNNEWKENDGGELLIYDDNEKFLAKVLPKMGTLVVFLSDIFPHEVLPSNKKRHSIAGWFRVDKR
jgi:SM-20-related protein